MRASESARPIKLGNPEDISMLDLAHWIRELTGLSSPITFVDRPSDDPEVRRPVITRAFDELGRARSVELKARCDPRCDVTQV